ncbi:hypothetical protein SA2016_1106 [Sinomonas atrocyanea]|jgi:hypothetical protein|uniref:Uncharacterized protein n=1 Tax=Sinomonas atrocyanea TaxID=37927 RepID=A0A126ZX72_9MICC|nr:hypothetical protein [Sinomonas atrocyanea]AMM31788.1 hypothetical protein SA2016_1106 [Sinomonas atrocyanea]GEB65603.1 hypothetical protein SAT01_30510 [Sinomonas atrocyanea]GGG70327.1 hypothetical protein GCM10007172_23220 [Sinomonas atrocyanea]
MASIDNQDPARSLSEEEDPSLDFSVEPDEKVWDEEDGLIDAEDVVVEPGPADVPEADPADVAEQHRGLDE